MCGVDVKSLVIDENKCIKCGVCVAMNDKIFQFTDDYSKVIVKKFDPSSVTDEEVDEIINACPVTAITKVDA